MAILTLENVSFTYPEALTPAVSSVDLSVQAGEFIVLCGHSGCGKSTLLRLLKRELTPFGEQTGAIRLYDKPLSAWDARTSAARIGFVMQDPEAQIVTDTVWHELAFGMESLGYDPAFIRRRVAEMAAFFGIEHTFHNKTATLSGGQKQLLCLAAIMACDPQVLLLDEPTAMLDPLAASQFLNTLHRLNHELGVTVVLIEHRLEEVLPLADRVLLMENGRIVLNAPPRRLFEAFETRPDDPMREALPTAMRLFAALRGTGACPLTVREGRRFVMTHYDNCEPALPIATPPTGDAVMRLHEVFFRYEKIGTDVLRGLTLTVHRAEHLCLVGGNGAGKSTALAVMAGLHRPYRGRVTFDGKPLDKYKGDSLYQNGVALLPQQPQALFTEKTVADDLRRICPDAATVDAVADRLGLSHLLSRHPYDLSGGELQRAAIAMLLLRKPRLLLLDEPTKGLDAGAKQELRVLLDALVAEGVTVVTVTHDIEFAAASADRVGLVFDGALVSLDTPTPFFANNRFYTTAAARIAAGYYKNVALCEQLIALCEQNGRRDGEAS